MKYRIIIADDEKKIIQLIKQLGHWDELGIEIIDECHDGKSALNSILLNKPDIVLSDIKMPEYDGIQLIESVRKNGMNTLFILLSGYRHFEYARSAIQLNVIDYILKPIDAEQLNETLAKACKQLALLAEQDINHKKLEEYESVIEQNQLEEFWNLITQGMRKKGEKILFTENTCISDYPTNFIYNRYQIIYVETNLYGIRFLDDSLFTEKINSFIAHSFKDIAQVIHYTDYIGNIIIINYDDSKKSEIKSSILSLFYQIRDLNEIYGDFRINIGCSKVKLSYCELIDAFEEAIAAEWGRLVFLGNQIFEFEQIRNLPRFDSKSILSVTLEREIIDSITYLRNDELGGIFAETYNKAASYNNSNPLDMIDTFMSLQAIVLDCIHDNDLKERIKLDFYYAYQNAKSFQQTLKNIYIKLDGYIEEEQKKVKEKMVKPIEEALRYMKHYYSNPISLEVVAENSNISPSYLSRLFKEEMGIGFSDYLIQIRLEESKRMLSETNQSIKAIALRVGYTDEKYYSKLFRKVTGIKPTDYRRLYG